MSLNTAVVIVWVIFVGVLFSAAGTIWAIETLWDRGYHKSATCVGILWGSTFFTGVAWALGYLMAAAR